MPGQRIKHLDAFDLIVEHRHTHGVLCIFSWENVDHVAAHTKNTAFEFHVVALVLHLGQAFDGFSLRQFFILAQVQNHAVIIHRVADTVDR